MLDERDLQLIRQAFAEEGEKTRADFRSVIESEVEPKLQTLAEGQETILERVVPVSRIEALESDVVVLKAAIRHLSAELAQLKKAN